MFAKNRRRIDGLYGDYRTYLAVVNIDFLLSWKIYGIRLFVRFQLLYGWHEFDLFAVSVGQWPNVHILISSGKVIR